MNSSEIRRRFLAYFEDRGHEIYDSAPLLPSDPELLFNIAGMVPFKPYFLGDTEPEYNRVTSSQKCIRTEDIENVGITARHLTFFEMLGNFSFGDYFKEDAIRYAWEFLTGEMGLPPRHLWITVFGGDEEQDLEPDEEAEEIWSRIDGVSRERILRVKGPVENFWKMGRTGPCGPCSEILYDQKQGDPSPEQVKEMILSGRDRILELWNLVFMQFNRSRDGTLSPLPNQNIDTGLGLERLAAVMQDRDDNYGSDLFRPIIRRARTLADLPPLEQGEEVEADDVEGFSHLYLFPDRGIDRETALNQQRAGRVIADHIRAASFLLAEGLIPGNEGRGYVLRRLIRRALRWGRRVGFDRPFLHELVGTVVEIMGEHYDELTEKQSLIEKRLRREEEQFLRTLDQGMDELRERIRRVRRQSGENQVPRLSGQEVFELYETYGFPVEMTLEILDEEGIQYREEEIEEAREQHRQQSSGSWKGGREEQKLPVDQFPRTRFEGYEGLEAESTVLGIFRDGQSVEELEEGEEARIIVDRTPFYPEGGGQVGDRGHLNGFRVEDTQSQKDRIVHLGQAETSLEVGEVVEARVERLRRRATMRHHTATHLLQAALRERLGEGVMQSGSLVHPDYLRFDFTHDERISRTQLRTVEERVNEWVYREIPLTARRMDREEAEQEGALAFFGEHYEETVRVVSIGDVSVELCGGTHLSNTGQLGLFTITGESSVAAGVRRIEARAGKPAYDYLADRREVLYRATDTAGVQRPGDLAGRIDELRETLEEQEEELETYRRKESARRAEKLAEKTREIAGLPVVIEQFEDQDSETLNQMLDRARQQLEKGVVLLVNRSGDSVNLLLGVTENLTDEIDAGEWIQSLGSIVGGGGGGRPGFAQAGGSDPGAVPEAIQELEQMIREHHGSASRR